MDSARYTQNAQRCRNEAMATKVPKDREAWLEMAATWQRMADAQHREAEGGLTEQVAPGAA